jgi:drug/metabolite transporter superfamily protein YnfA
LVYIDNTCVDTKDGRGGWANSYWGLSNFNQMVWIRGMNVFSLGTGNTRSSAGTQYSFSSFSDLANWLRNNASSSYWVDIGDTVGPITPAGPLPTLVSARFVGRNMTIYGGVFSGYAPNLEILDTGDYMEQINDSFCASCPKLANVMIGVAVKSIGRYAFANCVALTSMDIPSNVEAIDSETFSNSSNLTTITINKPQGSISGAPWGATNATVVWTG